MRRGDLARLAFVVALAARSAAAQSISLVDHAGDAGLGAVVAHGAAWFGAGLAFVDLDGDDWPDLYFGAAMGETDWLCRNQRDGHFDCAPAPGAVVNPGDVLAIAAGDVDGDGDLDLYVMREGPCSLYLNDGHGHFRDVTDERHAGTDLTHPITSTGTFFDFDGDGRLDLFLGHWRPGGMLTPEAQPQILQQQRDGTFVDVTAQSGVNGHNRPSLAMLAFDWDKDGRQDLWLTGDFNPTLFFHNAGGGRFVDVTGGEAPMVVSAVTEGMGIDAADLDGDGNVDVYATGNQVTNQGSYVFGKFGSALLYGHGDGTFDDLAVQLGVNAGYSWGTGLVDFDNDGLIDIFVATDLADHHTVYLNQGSRSFVEADVPNLVDGRNDCVTAAFADYDGDGRVDVALHRIDGFAPQLFHNETATANHWLKVELRTGHDELGARVQVTANGVTQERELLGQTSHGAMSDRRLSFGLGAATSATVTVIFPDGASVSAPSSADRELVLDRDGVVVPSSGCSYAPHAPTNGLWLLLLMSIYCVTVRHMPPSTSQQRPRSR